MSGQKKGSSAFSMHRRDAIYKNLYVDNLKGRKLKVTENISMCPVVIGENANVVSINSTAVGCEAKAGTGTYSTAVGDLSQAGTGNNTNLSTSIGASSKAGTSTGTFGSVAVGAFSEAGTVNDAVGSVAVGALAIANKGIAIGYNAIAANNYIAVGGDVATMYGKLQIVANTAAPTQTHELYIRVNNSPKLFTIPLRYTNISA